MNILKSISGLVEKSLKTLFARSFERGDDLDGPSADALTLSFQQSVWVMRAIKHVSGPISAVPLEFSETANPSSQLAAFWANPSPGYTWPDFVEATVGWLKLKGEAFWILDDSSLAPFPEVQSHSAWSPITIARPDRMTEILRAGELVGWTYITDSGKSFALLPEQVVHLKCWNPYNQFRGLAEYDAARIAAETDWLQGKFARNLAAANGDTGPMIIAKGGMPTTEQRDEIVRTLREKRAANLRGSFRPAFMAGDIDVKDANIKAPDAAFVASRLQNRHEIFIAFGVPASMADVQASYSIGSASDRYRLIEETCMPIGRKICAAIDQVNARHGLTTTTVIDWDEHSTLQAVRRERIEVGLKLWSTGMPMSLVSDYLALNLPEYPTSDTGYLPFGLSPADQSGLDLTQAPAYQEPPPQPAKALPDSPAPATVNRQWLRHQNQRRPFVKAIHAKLSKALFDARSEVLAKIQRSSTVQKSLGPERTKGVAADFTFSLNNFKASLLADLRPILHQALNTSATELYQEVGRSAGAFRYPPEKVLQFMQSRENKITDASDEIFTRIKNTLTHGLEKGDSLDDLSDRVRAEFNDIAKGRAVTIAMTETNAAYGQGREEGMQQAGIKFKQWLTSGAPNVRPSHLELEGKVVPINEPFPNGCRFPGDPDGPAGEVINCHCTHIPVESDQPDA